MNIIKSKLHFDVLLGSGTGNGAGEENKFLIDAYNAGLSIFYYPLEISSLHETDHNGLMGAMPISFIIEELPHGIFWERLFPLSMPFIMF